MSAGRRAERDPGQGVPPYLATTTMLGPVDARDELADQVRGTFVVVVELHGGLHHRRCFLTAAAAETAVQRAELAGLHAAAYLAELKPLWRLAGPVGRLHADVDEDGCP